MRRTFQVATLLATLGTSAMGAEDSYFGAAALSSLQAPHPVYEDLVTNRYSGLLRFAREPSLSHLPAGIDSSFRMAALGTSENPDCWTARFEFTGDTVKAAVSSFSVDHREPDGYGRLQMGARTLTDVERDRLRGLLARLDVTRLPPYPGRAALDVQPQLFEFRDREHHAIALRDVDYENGGLYEELRLLSFQVLRATRLQPVDPHEPPRRAPTPHAAAIQPQDSESEVLAGPGSDDLALVDAYFDATRSKFPAFRPVDARVVAPGKFNGEFEELLLRRDYNPRMSEVPRLTPDVEELLLERYSEAEGVTNKYRIVRILAFGGSKQATQLIRGLITQDYSDAAGFTDLDAGVLLNLPRVLAVVAAYDPDAMNLLLRGCEEGFWESLPRWPFRGEIEGARGPRTVSVSALGLCDQPQAKAALDELRDNPEHAIQLDVVGGVVDGAFNQMLVRKLGLRVTVDMRMDTEWRLGAFFKWRRTPEGRWWDVWYCRALGIPEAPVN